MNIATMTVTVLGQHRLMQAIQPLVLKSLGVHPPSVVPPLQQQAHTPSTEPKIMSHARPAPERG